MLPRRRVIVIGEDYQRVLPLLEALDAHVQGEFWNTSRGCLVTSHPPEDAVYFCRQSPSADSRGHAASVPYVRALLQWLEAYECTVVNGFRALAVETSKAVQMTLLRRFDVNTPRTVLITTRAQLRAELRAWPATEPLIIKPDMGGSGNGVAAYATPRTALGPASELVDIDAAPWVLQEHINGFSDEPSKMRSVLRFEIVDGRVLYVMQIRAPVTEFKLCPCDPRMKAMLSKITFRIVSDVSTIPCFAAPGAYAAFCAKLEMLWAHLHARVGSAEAFLPVSYADDVGDGRVYSDEASMHAAEPVVFELNFNSNYNATAEELAGVSGIQSLTDMLVRLASR